MLDMKITCAKPRFDDRMESLEATKPTKCAFFLKYLPPSMVAGESLDRRPTSTAKEGQRSFSEAQSLGRQVIRGVAVATEKNGCYYRPEGE